MIKIVKFYGDPAMVGDLDEVHNHGVTIYTLTNPLIVMKMAGPNGETVIQFGTIFGGCKDAQTVCMEEGITFERDRLMYAPKDPDDDVIKAYADVLQEIAVALEKEAEEESKIISATPDDVAKVNETKTR